MIPYGRQTISFGDVIAVAKQVGFKSLTQGSKVAEFEKNFACYVGAKYAVAVSNATAGLHLAVLALELPFNSRVVTSPISFVASSNAILYSKHQPVFLDINRKTLNLDSEKIEEELDSNPNVKCIIPVHFAGLPCDMGLIHEVSSVKNVKIIEDAAHALGASYKCGARVGSCKYSDLTVFSFHPVKSITTGEGGMITTNSNQLYKKLLRLRSHGINKLDDEFQSNFFSKSAELINPWYYEMQELGYNYRLTEIQSALGISQLNKVNKFIQKRTDKVSWYRSAISGSPYMRPAQDDLNYSSAHHIFPIRINFSTTRLSKAQLVQALRAAGVGCQVHYIPIPMQPYYVKLGFNCDAIPEAMAYYHEALTLPLFPRLRTYQQKKVIGALSEILDQNATT